MYKTIALAKYKIAFLAVAAVLLSLAFVPSAGAVGEVCSSDANCTTGERCCGDACTTDPFCIDVIGEPSGLGTASLQITIARIINVALSLLGVIAVVIILAGGFKWMLAGGNEEKTTEARKLIFAGIIGLAIILSAFAIARFVLSSLGAATGTGVTTGGAGL